MSKNESDLEYGECVNCGDEEVAKLGYYFWENEQYWFVECSECGYRTNEWGEANLAIDEWNGEEYEEEEDEDEEMLASVIRMLERERRDNDELRTLHGQQLVELAKEQETCETLRRLLKEAQDNSSDDLAAKCKRHEERIESLSLKIKQRDGELALKTAHHENQKGAWKKAHAEIMQLRIKVKDAEDALLEARCNHDDVLYVIDKTLSQMIKSVDIRELLAKMRDDEWRNNDPAENNNSHDTVLDEIMWRSSPYHREYNQEVYDFAITCLAQNATEVFTMELYGLVMEKYVQSSRMHQIAWVAAGRPGETIQNGRRPRT